MQELLLAALNWMPGDFSLLNIPFVLWETVEAAAVDCFYI